MESTGSAPDDQPDTETLSDSAPAYSPCVLEDLLGDTTRVCVLSVFLQHPGEIFLQKHIAEAVGVSNVMASRTIRELEDAGAIERVEEAFDDRYDGFRLAQSETTDVLSYLPYTSLDA